MKILNIGEKVTLPFMASILSNIHILHYVEEVKAMPFIESYNPEIILVHGGLKYIKELELFKWIKSFYNPYIILVHSTESLDTYHRDELELLDYADAFYKIPTDQQTLCQQLNLLICHPQALYQSLYKTKSNTKTHIDSRILSQLLEKTLQSVLVDLSNKELAFLSKALQIHMEDPRSSLYEQLAQVHGFLYQRSAYRKLEKIKDKINHQLENKNLLRQLKFCIEPQLLSSSLTD